jgi:hypothetical protein
MKDKKNINNPQPLFWFKEINVDGYQCLVEKVVEKEENETYHDVKISTQMKGGIYIYGNIECEDSIEMDIVFEEVDENTCAEILYQGLDIHKSNLN